MRSLLAFRWSLAASLAMALSSDAAHAALSITNGGFDAQDSSVHFNSTISPTGWFSGDNNANTQSDTMINARNGLEGGWDANGFLFGLSTPFTNDGLSELGYIYQSLGTRSAETSVTVTGLVYNRIPPGARDVGNFDVGLFYTSPGAFTPGDGLDIALSGSPISFTQTFTNGTDFTITPNTTAQKATWSSTIPLAGVPAGSVIWLRLGDAGNPTGAAADEPVIDNLNLAPYVLGDTDGNGVANMTDYTAIRNNFRKTGVTRAQGDVDGSGDTDLLDYLQWRRAFIGGGASPASVPSLTGVPEPASVVLTILAAMGALAPTRRRASVRRAS